MATRTDLPWTDFSPAALEIFHIWTDRHAEELRWASSAWTALQRAGLTSYTGEAGKALVLIRLVTLAMMYHEFADCAWQEYFTPDYVITYRVLDASIVSRITAMPLSAGTKLGLFLELLTDHTPGHLAPYGSRLLHSENEVSLRRLQQVDHAPISTDDTYGSLIRSRWETSSVIPKRKGVTQI